MRPDEFVSLFGRQRATAILRTSIAEAAAPAMEAAIAGGFAIVEFTLTTPGALEKDDQRGLRQFQREVAKWSDRAAEAWSALEAGEQQPSIKGAPTKDIEAAVRRVALREFEHLTDEQVAPKHPDYKALEEFFYLLFDALNLDPKNTVSQARTAVEERDTASDL